ELFEAVLETATVDQRTECQLSRPDPGVRLAAMYRRPPPAPSMRRAKPHRGPRTSPGDMEPIIAGRDLRKSWGATPVLEHADFLLHAGDKVALVGPNGSGKSTLFRLLAGETAPDLGDLVLKPGLRYGYLPQE